MGDSISSLYLRQLVIIKGALCRRDVPQSDCEYME